MKSAIHFWFGRSRLELPVQNVRRYGCDLAIAFVLRQTPAPWPRPQGLQAHQPLDPVQTAFDPLRQQVVPDPPRPIGPIALQEARSHPASQFLIAARPSARRSCQPGIEATARDTERPAQPSRRPDPPVLRDEGELHVDSFAK